MKSINMGNCIRILVDKLRRKKSTKNLIIIICAFVFRNIVLMMVGLDNAGKTLVLNHIANDPDRNVMPTMGFRTISLDYKSYAIKIYDLGGAQQIRSIWKRYYHDIHGVIYVVDASDVSRLTENKIVFSELITHENIAGKPILLLANKQDVPGAIDELDLVENLDVERAANSMRCPTRVETCSCLFEPDKTIQNTMGIINGFRWLLETISKNYATLDHRIKIAQSLLPPVNNRSRRKSSIISLAPSRASIRSNPFKPIHELIANSEQKSSNHTNHVNKKKSTFKKILVRNKTGPMPLEQSMKEDAKESSLNESVIEIEPFHESIDNDRVSLVTLDPLNLFPDHRIEHLRTQTRPFTAPAASNKKIEIFTMLNIPGQVSQ